MNEVRLDRCFNKGEIVAVTEYFLMCPVCNCRIARIVSDTEWVLNNGTVIQKVLRLTCFDGHVLDQVIRRSEPVIKKDGKEFAPHFVNCYQVENCSEADLYMDNAVNGKVEYFQYIVDDESVVAYTPEEV